MVEILHIKNMDYMDGYLQTYAEPHYRILDTHGGSMSIGIAGHYFGCNMVICEKNKHFFTSGVERFERETRQVAML